MSPIPESLFKWQLNWIFLWHIKKRRPLQLALHLKHFHYSYRLNFLFSTQRSKKRIKLATSTEANESACTGSRKWQYKCRGASCFKPYTVSTLVNRQDTSWFKPFELSDKTGSVPNVENTVSYLPPCCSTLAPSRLRGPTVSIAIWQGGGVAGSGAAFKSSPHLRQNEMTAQFSRWQQTPRVSFVIHTSKNKLSRQGVEYSLHSNCQSRYNKCYCHVDKCDSTLKRKK